jgi:hypothetical protein
MSMWASYDNGMPEPLNPRALVELAWAAYLRRMVANYRDDYFRDPWLGPPNPGEPDGPFIPPADSGAPILASHFAAIQEELEQAAPSFLPPAFILDGWRESNVNGQGEALGPALLPSNMTVDQAFELSIGGWRRRFPAEFPSSRGAFDFAGDGRETIFDSSLSGPHGVDLFYAQTGYQPTVSDPNGAPAFADDAVAWQVGDLARNRGSGLVYERFDGEWRLVGSALSARPRQIEVSRRGTLGQLRAGDYLGQYIIDDLWAFAAVLTATTYRPVRERGVGGESRFREGVGSTRQLARDSAITNAAAAFAGAATPGDGSSGSARAFAFTQSVPPFGSPLFQAEAGLRSGFSEYYVEPAQQHPSLATVSRTVEATVVALGGPFGTGTRAATRHFAPIDTFSQSDAGILRTQGSPVTTEGQSEILFGVRGQADAPPWPSSSDLDHDNEASSRILGGQALARWDFGDP